MFLLSQFFQTAQGLGPLEAGARTLPWTAMPMVVAPIAGILGERDRHAAADGRRHGAAGRRLWSGWRASSTPTTPYVDLIVPFVMAGTGMALVFAHRRETVLVAVRPDEAGKASGATNAIREIGGVMGVAVLAAVFARTAATGARRRSPTASSRRCRSAVAVLAVGALLALLVPGKPRAAEAPAVEEREAMAASAA